MVKNIKNISNNFVSLAPIVKKENNDIYQQALDFSTQEEDIFNIALSGPYGAGKSSIIKSFKKRKNDDFKILEISLASFKHDNKSEDIDPKEIEFSILQQMLYSEGAKTLPHSRFKRIKSPHLPVLKSTLLTCWLASAFVLYYNWKSLVNHEIWSADFLLFSFIVVALSLGSIAIFNALYHVFYGSSLKKISLKNIELETETTDSSILNKHLDEILYFFEQTDYRLIVFEDIDRFDTPEIFVKLREINTIVNSSKSVDQRVQFLYSIKESMFSERERTKFFDFIIPVVPVISTSNASDLMQERAANFKDLHSPINPNFIKDVSEYLNDARLIHNTFNEFYIYQHSINDRKIDTTHLFAIMLYKNVFGHDFEALHEKKGVFYNIVARKEEWITRRTQKIQNEAKNLKSLLTDSEKLFIENESQLADLYRMAIQKLHNQGRYVRINKTSKYISELTTEDIKNLRESGNVEITTDQNHAHHYNSANLRFNFQDVEEKIKSANNFPKFEKLLKYKLSSESAPIKEEIEELINIEIPKISSKNLVELLENESSIIDECIKEYSENNTIVDIGLFRFLILSGYLNENYTIYTSIFREQEGWTRNDREYYKAVKSRLETQPNQKIDNPKELLSRLNSEKIPSRYLLNVNILDELLSYNSKNNALLNLILKHLERIYLENEGQDFIKHYLYSGERIKNFLTHLLEKWPEFTNHCIKSPLAPLEIATLIDKVDYETILEYADNEKLKEYLEKSLGSLYINNLITPPNPKSFSYLYEISLRVSSIRDVPNNTEVFNYLLKNQLYAINIDNIHYLLEYYGASPQLIQSETYTQITKHFDSDNRAFIENHIDSYVHNIMLQCKKNKSEAEDYIYHLLDLPNISAKTKVSLLTHQDKVFTSIDNFKEELWTHLLQLRKIKFSWENIIKYANSFETDHDVLIEFLCEQEASTFSKPDENILSNLSNRDLVELVSSSDDLPSKNYIALLSELRASFLELPNVSYKKQALLINHGMLRLNETSFEEVQGNNELLVTLIQENLETFIEDIIIYLDELSHEVLLALFASGMPKEHKITLAQNIKIDQSKTSSNELKDAITPFYLEMEGEHINSDTLRHLVTFSNREDIGLELFKKCSEHLPRPQLTQILAQKVPIWSESITMEALRLLPEPYSFIANYGKRPKILANETNRVLLINLRKKEFIRSFKRDGAYFRISTKNKAPRKVPAE
ncbi:YobI family P-loop NTPase [Alteromonas sp. a30]|uniref:YobI family P-loop NTPase n=1 Tax=Alteromonas sp. a30 TaxID=2730917 RepID=UPI002282B269|nr:hypothetical protein [Alteromonas sp. a30]MCY7296505.1 hypothetical protein [Alteromonas sp. a30]